MPEDYGAYDDPRPATSGQLRAIARMSWALHLPEPVVKYSGEAGLLIRHYSAELEARRRRSSGNIRKEA